MESLLAMLRQFFSLTVGLMATATMGAIAIHTTLAPTLAQPAPKATSRNNLDRTLKMVMVDQAELTSSQRSTFQRYLETANLPPTKIGKRCQYYGKPQIWCLLLDPSVAEQVYQQLSRQPSFGSAAKIQTVHRIRGPKI
jgi:hypothetical protein